MFSLQRGTENVQYAIAKLESNKCLTQNSFQILVKCKQYCIIKNKHGLLLGNRD